MMKPPHPTTMENLPCEVLSEIFIRLLAKQLAQMRSVCKPWNTLLSEASFVKSHLNRSIQKNNEILLFFNMVSSIERSPLRARTSRSPDLELTNFIKLPLHLVSKFQHGFVIGTVNGLICFSFRSSLDDFGVYIWNPCLSAVLTLPPCPVNFQLLDFGFGYDPITHDYKVVKLGCFYRATNMVAQALVYSMRKGSWESISPQTFPSHITIRVGCNTQVCADDNLHWPGYTDYERKLETIVGFDLGAETFRVIPPPDSVLHHRLNVLGVLSGKLCVMSCVRYGGECEVWVMKEYGVPESWVKHRVFPPFSGHIIPYGFTSHGEFLFQVDNGDDCFGLYDPSAAKTKTFKIMSRYSSIMRFAVYVDSLVWIELANQLPI